MKAAIYCRVSTDDQEKEGTSLQTQREACLAYCKQKGYQGWEENVATMMAKLLLRDR